MKKLNIYLPIIFSILFASGLGLGYFINQRSGSGVYLTSSNPNKQKLNRLIDVIDQRYVDDVNTDSIVDATVNNILSNLDPHSVYISSEEQEETNNSMRGTFTGIGIRFFISKDTVSVLQAIPNGPGKKAGIQAGDKIIAANGKPLTGNNASNTNILKGKRGSVVKLSVIKPGFKKPVIISIKRDDVPLPSVEASYMLTDILGYIKVNRFSETTKAEFQKALINLKSRGAKDITLDLRDNPGGVLDAAIAMADEFLANKNLIVYQKDRNGKRKDSYATNNGNFQNGMVYILINENSASASEVVAGALQDNDKGVIIGRRSFGKGLVQQEIKLGDGSSVRLTVARYYTPTGRSIQRPYENGNENYYNEYIERYENGELLDASKIKVNDSLRKTTKGGKIVYGGGGIIPDVFVPSPDGYNLQTIDYMARTGTADQFANILLSNKAAYLRKMSFDTFTSTYQPSLTDISEMILQLRIQNTSIKAKQYQEELTLLLKASMAEQLYGTEQKWMLLNESDTMIIKVKNLNK